MCMSLVQTFGDFRNLLLQFTCNKLTTFVHKHCCEVSLLTHIMNMLCPSSYYTILDFTEGVNGDLTSTQNVILVFLNDTIAIQHIYIYIYINDQLLQVNGCPQVGILDSSNNMSHM